MSYSPRCMILTVVLSMFMATAAFSADPDDETERGSGQGSIMDMYRKELQRTREDVGLTEGEEDPAMVGVYSGEASDILDIKVSVSKEMIRKMSRELKGLGEIKKDLTESEVEILADNPEEMYKLGEIADFARGTAGQARKADPTVPEDAYRHILWSYLLTKEFGPDFARKVTDAHEDGDFENTEQEHEMDYVNNAVGRKYALTGTEEDDILIRLKTDPDVIKYPGERKYRPLGE